ncbi:hypothetical protein L6R52_43860, partial [Myxococcota bacterium]|nr:hypothetical protein [Myxococcota bacterium]
DLAKEAEQLLGALEYERARERLEGAVAGNTLRGASVTARAKIWALLGRARAELGDALGADEAFEQAVALDRRVRLPKSTSPKILDALERARANAPAPGDAARDEAAKGEHARGEGAKGDAARSDTRVAERSGKTEPAKGAKPGDRATAKAAKGGTATKTTSVDPAFEAEPPTRDRPAGLALGPVDADVEHVERPWPAAPKAAKLAALEALREAKAAKTGARAEGAKTADAKTADAKTADAKAADAKTADAKTADAKVAGAKTADAKTADAKAADAKNADASAATEAARGGSGGDAKRLDVAEAAAKLELAARDDGASGDASNEAGDDDAAVGDDAIGNRARRAKADAKAGDATSAKATDAKITDASAHDASARDAKTTDGGAPGAKTADAKTADTERAPREEPPPVVRPSGPWIAHVVRGDVRPGRTVTLVIESGNLPRATKLELMMRRSQTAEYRAEALTKTGTVSTKKIVLDRPRVELYVRAIAKKKVVAELGTPDEPVVISTLPPPPALVEAWSTPERRPKLIQTSTTSTGTLALVALQPKTSTKAATPPIVATKVAPKSDDTALWIGLAVGGAVVVAGVIVLVVLLTGSDGACDAPEGFGCTEIQVSPLVSF